MRHTAHRISTGWFLEAARKNTMASRIEPELPADAHAQADDDRAWTLPNVQKDFTDWRAGRHRYAVWAIDLDHDWLREASENMRRHCANLLLPHYARQPHITLRICGFPSSDRRLDDNYTQADFAAQVSALASAWIDPFPISIGALDTFTTAPYFSVLDIDDGIARARQTLAMPAGDGPGEKGYPYVPHVTFGLYGVRFPMADAVRRLRSGLAIENVLLTIKRLTLMTYEASRISGPLTSVCEFDLESQSLGAVDAETMEALFR